MEKLLSRCQAGCGRKAMTVFFGLGDSTTAAALEQACRQQHALIFFLYDGPARFQSAPDSLMFHASAAEPEHVMKMLARVFEHFGLEEGFQIKTAATADGETLLEKYREPILSLMSELKFRRRAEMMLWRCLRQNLSSIVSRRLPILENPEAAVLICAAGPSLDSQCQSIQQYRSRFHLFCVGRAYAKLREHGIEPDLVVEIDPEGQGFTTPSVAPVCPLAAPPLAAPGVVSCFSEVLWLADPGLERNLLLEEQGIVLPQVVVSRSVIVTAIDLAVRMGYRHIALTGSDLCLDAAGSLYGGGKEHGGVNIGTVKLPGNDGSDVLSLPGLSGIREALQNYLSTCPTKVCNCTSGGVRIEHTSRQALELWAKKFSFPGLFTLPPSQKMATAPGKTVLDLNAAAEEFVAVAMREAQPGQNLTELSQELLEELSTDSNDIYRYRTFRHFALAFIRRRNPDYAVWLERSNEPPKDFTVKSWLLSLPRVRFADTGATLTSGDNREHAAYDAIRGFADGNLLDPARDAVVIAGPGDWLPASELVRCYPALPVMVLDPHPELFSRLIDYTLFLHWFPADTYIAGASPVFDGWRRGAQSVIREWKRAGRRILTFPHPALAGNPAVTAILQAIG